MEKSSVVGNLGTKKLGLFSPLHCDFLSKSPIPEDDFNSTPIYMVAIGWWCVGQNHRLSEASYL